MKLEESPFKLQYETHLFNFINRIDVLIEDEGMRPYQAFNEVSLEILGIDKNTSGFSSPVKTDGSGDRGIDYYQLDDSVVHIYQFKGPDTNSHKAYSKSLTPTDITDIPRILSYIRNCFEPQKAQNKRVKDFQSKLQTKLKNPENEVGTTININFVASKNEISKETAEEIKGHQEDAKSITEINGTLVEVNLQITTIQELMEELFKQDNNEWKDITGKKDEKLTLNVNGGMIDDDKCITFYTNAIKLKNAYDKFGHRLFSPNVRCYLSKTSVNSKISTAVSTKKGMDAFKYLNNGVTIICENWVKKESKQITISKPGVINGLQTIRSISDAYSILSKEEKQYFDTECQVFVRLFNTKKINFQTDELIISTNHQNQMDPRNLKSNTETQKFYEKEFAKYNWFYERKERAWEAFSESEGDWTTLPNIKPSYFGPSPKSNRKILDNVHVATSFLAFTGKPKEARNDKKKIFTDEKVYSSIFQQHIKSHQWAYESQESNIDNEKFLPDHPPPSMLLLATIIYDLARSLSKTKTNIDNEYKEQLNLGDKSPEEAGAALVKNSDYLSELMINSIPLIIVCVYGYLFLQIPASDRAAAATKILNNTDIKTYFEKKDTSYIKDKVDNKLDESDLFLGVYGMVKKCMKENASSIGFKNDLVQASSRPSFLHQDGTISRIKDQLIEWNDNIPSDKWTTPFTGRKILSTFQSFCNK